MDVIQKAILFGGKAIVSVVDARQLTQTAVDKQCTNDAAGEALGRVLAIGAFMSAGIKGADIRLSITIDGGGQCGKIIVAGQTGGVVRGFVQNRQPNVSRNENAKFDMSECVGCEGSITVIKDFGMKSPYVGKTQLVNGTIDSDFAYYFTTSEGLPSAVSSGAEVTDGVVQSCGCIIVQPMPNCEDEYIVVLQDIVRNFADFGSLIKQKTPEQIIEENFGHFDCKMLAPITPRFECQCSEERMKNIIRSLDKAELEDILAKENKVEIHCDFCNTNYVFEGTQIEQILADK